ncbi:hypothetical protein, partial [Klebsiella variicola]|uniref:hypothetical protein n=1 Tax=Klebsiella variicola TaxID=244366 RepID=UPI003565B670
EWVHVQLHQQKGMISLSPPTICNSAAKTTITHNPHCQTIFGLLKRMHAPTIKVISVSEMTFIYTS